MIYVIDPNGTPVSCPFSYIGGVLHCYTRADHKTTTDARALEVGFLRLDPDTGDLVEPVGVNMVRIGQLTRQNGVDENGVPIFETYDTRDHVNWYITDPRILGPVSFTNTGTDEEPNFVPTFDSRDGYPWANWALYQAVAGVPIPPESRNKAEEGALAESIEVIDPDTVTPKVLVNG